MSAAADALMGIFGFKRVESEMKTDRELLELAAKEAGLDAEWTEYTNADPAMIVRYKQPIDGISGYAWNPLCDDGDALRLAVNLKFQIIIYKDWVEILQDGIRVMNADSVYYAGCMIETTRRAIVRAAAAIGEQME